jgi:hypothetical protein
LGSGKQQAMSNIKRLSHHRGKDEISQNVEGQFWNGLVSELAQDIAIKVFELISEGIRHLHNWKSTEVRDFRGDSLQFFPYLPRM